MTRKDFEAIAAVLDQTRPPDLRDEYTMGRCVGWKEVVSGFASMLVHHNPRFDRARFLTACGLKPTEIP